jgi:broad specificity phosphatase PhoE
MDDGLPVESERRNIRKWENLFLVRHGESTCNEINRFAGDTDVPLTPLGQEQARQAARDCRGISPDSIFVSPLKRARETAEILFPTEQSELAHKIDARISERNFGSFTLNNKAHIQRSIGIRGFDEALYGDCHIMVEGEKFSDFYQRVLDFLAKELHPLLMKGKRVFVIAHKYVIELLARLILRLSTDDSFDLRLPNAKVINGAELGKVLGRESRWFNRTREWVVLNHSFIWVLAALFGAAINQFGWLPAVSPLISVAILGAATGISVSRVDLKKLFQPHTPSILAIKQLLIRYTLIPLLVLGAGWLSGFHSQSLVLALLMAAPAAVTGITVSRCNGGFIIPTVSVILVSTSISILVILSVLSVQGVEGRAITLLLPFAVAFFGIILPTVLAYYARKRYPIKTAHFAEHNGATAVILLALFIVLAFQGVAFDSFVPYGLVAFALGIVVRLLAWILARRYSIFGIDDYISFAYPNVFLVIVLANMIDFPELHQTAVWYLLPMFILATFDESLCRRIASPTHDNRLKAFLRIPQTAPCQGPLENDCEACANGSCGRTSPLV